MTIRDLITMGANIDAPIALTITEYTADGDYIARYDGEVDKTDMDWIEYDNGYLCIYGHIYNEREEDDV